MGEDLAGPPKVYPLSIGFLTALVKDELLRFEALLQDRGWAPPKAVNKTLKLAGVREWTKKISGIEVGAYTSAISGMGQTRSAIETMGFLTRCKPDIAVLCGIAGSLEHVPGTPGLGDPDIAKRDVVVATAIHWRMQNKLSAGDPCDTYRVSNYPTHEFDADTTVEVGRFLDKKYGRSDGQDFKVVHGEIFTWDYVLNNDKRADIIKSDFPSALCVEMEAGAFVASVQRYNKIHQEEIQPFVVRGISDYARKKDSVPADRHAASRNASAVAIELGEHMAQRYIDHLA